jgi:hypothetical protein
MATVHLLANVGIRIPCLPLPLFKEPILELIKSRAGTLDAANPDLLDRHRLPPSFACPFAQLPHITDNRLQGQPRPPPPCCPIYGHAADIAPRRSRIGCTCTAQPRVPCPWEIRTYGQSLAWAEARCLGQTGSVKAKHRGRRFPATSTSPRPAWPEENRPGGT